MHFDIVILADMHQPGMTPSDWRANIKAYLNAGGSVLQIFRHHILGEVSLGVKRIYSRRRIVVQPGHPAVAGLEDFSASFEDHIAERVGPAGTPLLEDDVGEVVAAAGRIGKGKVINIGLGLCMPKGMENPAEKRLLANSLSWLRPDVSQDERVAALGEGLRVSVSPAAIMAAAGFEAKALLRVGPLQGDDTLAVTLDGRALSPSEDQEGRAVRTYPVRIAVPSGRSTETVHKIVAKRGAETIRTELQVKGVHAVPPEDEVRGLWLHVRTDRYPKDVMPELKELGITHTVLRIAGGTAAFYASKVQPDVQDPLSEEGGDWLADAIEHAHANGIEMHPYVNNCIVEGRTSPESLARLKRENRLQQSPTGDTIEWFCPSHPQNLVAVTRPMVEIASTYDIDGIQYDFIRYPSSQGCFCPRCRALFEEETGAAVESWPGDVLEDGARYDAWIEFRCRRISAIVEHVSAEIRKVNPTATISAAVFSDWPGCRVSKGQDWVRWCEEGWLDMVFPMTYTQDSAQYDRLIRAHVAAVPEGFPVVEGIGIRSGAGTMQQSAKVALHLALARRAGAAGWCGFAYSPEHTRELFEPLTPWLDAEPLEQQR